MINQDILLSIDGMGIVICSNEAMKSIEEGDNFFKKEFDSPQKVSWHIPGTGLGSRTGAG